MIWHEGDMAEILPHIGGVIPAGTVVQLLRKDTTYTTATWVVDYAANGYSESFAHERILKPIGDDDEASWDEIEKVCDWNPTKETVPCHLLTEN